MFSLFLSGLMSNACSWKELLFPFLPRISLGSPSLAMCLWWILGSSMVEQLQFGNLKKIWLQKRYDVWESIISSFACLGHTFVVLRAVSSVEEDSFLVVRRESWGFLMGRMMPLWWHLWLFLVMLFLGVISQRIMNRKMETTGESYLTLLEIKYWTRVALYYFCFQ